MIILILHYVTRFNINITTVTQYSLIMLFQLCKWTVVISPSIRFPTLYPRTTTNNAKLRHKESQTSQRGDACTTAKKKAEKETYGVKLCEYLTCETKRGKNKEEGRNRRGEEILRGKILDGGKRNSREASWRRVRIIEFVLKKRRGRKKGLHKG